MNMAQMKVLSAARKQAFNSVPKLTKEATLGYFTLDLETKKSYVKCNRMWRKWAFSFQRLIFKQKDGFLNRVVSLLLILKELRVYWRSITLSIWTNTPQKWQLVIGNKSSLSITGRPTAMRPQHC